MEVFSAFILFSIWITTIACKIMNDAKSTHFLKFIQSHSFWYLGHRNSDFLSLGNLFQVCVYEESLYSSFELEKLPKDLHKIVPCNHLSWFKCLASEMPFLATPAQVLPMFLLSEIQMQEKKVPCERSVSLDMAQIR